MRTQSKDCREFSESGCGNGLMFCPFMWQDIFLYVLENFFHQRSCILLLNTCLLNYYHFTDSAQKGMHTYKDDKKSSLHVYSQSLPDTRQQKETCCDGEAVELGGHTTV